VRHQARMIGGGRVICARTLSTSMSSKLRTYANLLLLLVLGLAAPRTTVSRGKESEQTEVGDIN
jgi:hypothetical protein